MTYAHISSRAVIKGPYRLDSLDTVPAPQGCDGTWYRYVISQGDNKIVGMRCGVHSEVSLVLADYVERLNMRSSWPGAKSAR